jgi:aryl-alcohol dehydrogenase-like predicted oxidoreductase
LRFKLSYKTLGKTGLKVTSVGMGCMITSDPSVVTRAADLGITYFDTARGYQHGNNERMVGAALGSKRKQVVLSTKTEARDKAGQLAQLDTSLSELKTDYVDIWYLHGKTSPDDIHDDMIEALQLAKQQGKARFVGISTHSGQAATDSLDGAEGRLRRGAVGLQLQHGPSRGAGDRRGRQGRHGRGCNEGDGRRLRATRSWRSRRDAGGAEVGDINNPSVATTIPSMTDMDQLDENLKAMAGPLTADDHKILAAHLEQIQPLYCRMCGKCDGTCAQGLPVADVLRFLTYADGYGQFALGRERFLAELASEHDPAARCGDCAECTVKCPHGVHVSKQMARAQELFA